MAVLECAANLVTPVCSLPSSSFLPKSFGCVRFLDNGRQLEGKKKNWISLAARSETLQTLSKEVKKEASRNSCSEFGKFLEACQHGNLVPIQKRIFSDQLTPVLAYRCLVKEDDREAPSFLFESVENSESGNRVGRYSMVGAQPEIEIVAKQDRVTILNHKEASRVEHVTDDPFVTASDLVSKWRAAPVEGLPDSFCGGWVGFFSYDTVRYVEKKKLPFEKAPKDDRALPDIHLGLYKDVVVFDHVSKIVYVLHWICIDEFNTEEEAYENGKSKLESLVARLQSFDM